MYTEAYINDIQMIWFLYPILRFFHSIEFLTPDRLSFYTWKPREVLISDVLLGLEIHDRKKIRVAYNHILLLVLIDLVTVKNKSF